VLKFWEAVTPGRTWRCGVVNFKATQKTPTKEEVIFLFWRKWQICRQPDSIKCVKTLYYYYYYTIWMSVATGLFFLLLLLNQRWSPPFRLQASHCSTFRTLCDIIIIIIIIINFSQGAKWKKKLWSANAYIHRQLKCFARVNLLKPTGHVMHQQFNIQQLYTLPTLYLCVLYLSENKQRLVPLTA